MPVCLEVIIICAIYYFEKLLPWQNHPCCSNCSVLTNIRSELKSSPTWPPAVWAYMRLHLCIWRMFVCSVPDYVNERVGGLHVNLACRVARCLHSEPPCCEVRRGLIVSSFSLVLCRNSSTIAALIWFCALGCYSIILTHMVHTSFRPLLQLPPPRACEHMWTHVTPYVLCTCSCMPLAVQGQGKALSVSFFLPFKLSHPPPPLHVNPLTTVSEWVTHFPSSCL